MSAAADIARSVLELLGKTIAKKLLGDPKQADLPVLEAAIKRAVPDALAAAQARLEALIRQEIRALGLTLEIRDLADDVSRVPDAFEPPAGGGMVGRALDGAQITILGPGESIDDAPVIDGQPVASIGEDGK